MEKVEKATDPKRGWYRQIGVSQETFRKLDALKDRKAKALGIEPSWNEFFLLMMPVLEKEVSR